ncbi:MAG: hypothetical protein U9Q30_00410 [Campylobacterota bacterium]|nr:hypothetical protein [Campylobacterota bacterium]
MNNKNLPTTQTNSKAVIQKSNFLFGLKDKLITKDRKDLVDDSWIYRLWAWADENKIPDYKWIEQEEFDDGGYWGGLPRDKQKLINSTKFNLYNNQITKLPKEIATLSNLTSLYLGGNKLIELPKEIGKLSNLTSLDLRYNPTLILTQEQKEWIKNLINRYGTGWYAIEIDDNLLDRTNDPYEEKIPAIDIDYDEIPF